MSEDITCFREARHAAIARYLACEQADRDNPYHDGRHSSRETIQAHWEAIQAIAAYRQAWLELRAWVMTMQVVCAMCSDVEREKAA